MEQLGENSPAPYISGMSLDLDHQGDPIAALVSLDDDDEEEEEETAENTAAAAAAIVLNNNAEETAENDVNGLASSDATSEL